MEKLISYLGKKFRVRYFFDADVRENRINPDTGEEYSVILGDVEGIEIYDSQENLIGSFNYVNFDNDSVIRNLIKNLIIRKEI